jgi:aminopeptidase N
MLRQRVGDDVFFSALRTFYDEQKFKKAGTDDLRRVFEEASGESLERFFEGWIYGSEIPSIRYATTIQGSTLVLRFEQLSAQTFDLPVTVTVTYTNGGSRNFVVAITEPHVEHRLALDGPVRQVQVNRDNAALANFVVR